MSEHVFVVIEICLVGANLGTVRRATNLASA